MKKITFFLASVAVAFTFSTVAKAEYKFNFVMHSDTNNAFWAAVHKGFKDACAQVDADCQMLTLSGDGDQQEQLQNLESSIAQGVDGIVTTITNPTIFDAAVDEALAAGIPVITANTDDPEGAAGSNRLAYIGQDLEKAGYELEPAFGAEDTTLVVSIPVDVGEGVRTLESVSMWEQVSIAALAQRYWADNQVSCTVTFDPESEGSQIANALDVFQYQLKGNYH